MNATQKYELIRLVLNGEENPEQASEETGIPRGTIYYYLKGFHQGDDNIESLANESHADQSHPKLLILMEVRQPRKPSQPLCQLTHYHQIWFIDHMDLGTLQNGQEVYSLVIVDGMSRVLPSDEICSSKGARDAVLILLSGFHSLGIARRNRLR